MSLPELTDHDALIALRDEATTVGEMNYLDDVEAELHKDRSTAMRSIPKLGELTIQDGVVVDLESVQRQRAAGQQPSGPYDGLGRRS